MKYLLPVLFSILSTCVHAQEDSAVTRSSGYKPLIHLSRDEIQRLPVMTFAELVNQAFSFVSGNPFQEDDYTYEVDGFVTIHPNSINIGQIESITFYPGSIRNTRSSLTKNGTFVITTSKVKAENTLSVSNKSGFEVGNDRYPINAKTGTTPYSVDSDPSFFTLSEVVYATQLKKFSLNSSFSYARRGDPPSSGEKPGDSVYMEHINKRYRFSNFLGYRFNESVALDAGIFFTQQDNDWLNKQVYTPIYSSALAEVSRSNYYGAALGLHTIIFKRISNELNAEGNQFRVKGASAAEGLIGNMYQISTWALNSRDEYYMITNKAKSTFQLTRDISVEPSLYLRYRFGKHKVVTFNEVNNGNGFPIQASESMATFDSKGFSFSPDVALSIKKLLTVYGGGTWDNYRVSIYQNDSKLKFYPVGGFRFDAASLLPSGIVSSLYLSSDYGRYIISQEKLNLSFDATVFTSSSPFFPLLDKPNTMATRWVSSIGTDLWEKRLGVKVNYLEDEFETLFVFPVPGSIYTYSFEPIERKGWGAEICAEVIRKEKFHWQLRTNLFEEKFTTKNKINIPPAQVVNGNYFFNTDEKQLKGSFFTKIEAGNFFLQGSALLSFNQPKNNNITGHYDYSDQHGVNFLIIGYKKILKDRDVKDFEISLQTRNLVLPESTENVFYQFRYFGVGAKVEL